MVSTDMGTGSIIFGFIGAIAISAGINAIITKIINRKPQQCELHNQTIEAAREERLSLADEVKGTKTHLDRLTQCFYELDKRMSVFIESSKARQDIIIELSGAIKSMAQSVCKERSKHAHEN